MLEIEGVLRWACILPIRGVGQGPGIIKGHCRPGYPGNVRIPPGGLYACTVPDQHSPGALEGRRQLGDEPVESRWPVHLRQQLLLHHANLE